MPPAPDEVDEMRRFLGLPSGCSPADVEAARRRLSKLHHPDVGGDAEHMQRVNAAADRVLAHLGAATPSEGGAPASGARAPGGGHHPRHDHRHHHRHHGHHHHRHDHPSFTVEALPVEAFEGLLIVANELGDVIDDDPPYVLEVALREPQRGWCRLELVPDAGASTVSLIVAGEPGLPAPDLDVVRDAWIEGLNSLDWSDLSEGAPLPPS